ncbi:hypothetical protein MGU_11552 [Metarhizium guizhouense ARSEF 977]|uniref:Cell wall cysteine-rich protein n=1 Tax=Metarhizium guizhouense (strain ARSEF 977) TaxID=1276136 RepID=A0A0B4GF47_METGA|nr:hypothetical protein MGU_11552 [Metarhizium guizhouense ARSEF 977]
MKVAILFLAAALGSASPVPAQNSIQDRDGQNACDCSKPFEVFPGELNKCPEGYKNISPVFIPHCIQIGCSAEDHKAKCDAKPQDAKPSTAAEKRANTIQAQDGQNTCDCSKPFEVFPGELDKCPEGYKNISPVFIPHCVQIGCSAEDHKAKCDAKPQDAKPSTAAEKRANTIQAQDGQNTCDCSKPFEVFPGELDKCPEGYKNISPVFIPHCVQIGCSAEDHKAKCDAKPQDAKPSTAAEKRANTIQAQDGQNTCDCSKPFEVFPGELNKCPEGYKNISPVFIPHCVQIGCSAEDHKAKCSNNKPTTAKSDGQAPPQI